MTGYEEASFQSCHMGVNLGRDMMGGPSQALRSGNPNDNRPCLTWW